MNYEKSDVYLNWSVNQSFKENEKLILQQHIQNERFRPFLTISERLATVSRLKKVTNGRKRSWNSQERSCKRPEAVNGQELLSRNTVRPWNKRAILVENFQVNDSKTKESLYLFCKYFSKIKIIFIT